MDFYWFTLKPDSILIAPAIDYRNNTSPVPLTYDKQPVSSLGDIPLLTFYNSVYYGQAAEETTTVTQLHKSPKAQSPFSGLPIALYIS